MSAFFISVNPNFIFFSIMHKFTNRLIDETSPYLLQHAHNPVDWHPWDEKALDLAKKENKPILVSIGYSACHWCHVMERESFEDEATARIMNDHFINIKIDREERPDLDHIYMDAVQAMTGSGGWPLNVFLTPGGKPFYGGTYFPPKKAFNRPSWVEILTGVHEAFAQRRNEIDSQAENLTEHLTQANSFGMTKSGETNFFTTEKTFEAFNNIMKNADRTWGGFGRAPKFPQSFVIQYLLRFSHINENNDAFQQALVSIDKMIDGGIYDQVAGGFARYSTDTEWLVPHFEKMLYDNALLISIISEAYQLSKKERYREIIDETVEFIQRELMHPQKGFYSALDADSEGEEGKFYVWNFYEVNEFLKQDAALFCEFFDITPNGNWEGNNIPRRKKTAEAFCAEKNISIEHLNEVIHRGKKILLEKRAARVRPQTDDKLLLSWNALMNTALSKAFAATGNKTFKDLAIANMQFLLGNFAKDETGFFHSWKDAKAKHSAFLDDYAFLVQALIQLQEVTGDTQWLVRAKKLTEHVIGNFSDNETDFFFYTSREQRDVIIRKKEVYDGAQPSGNAVMAENLYRVGIYFDQPGWRDQAARMIGSLGNAIVHYPTSFGVWACLMMELTEGTNEIALISGEPQNVLLQVLKQYIPHRVIMAAEEPSDSFPLLSGKINNGKNTLYLCRNYACEKPVNSVEAMMDLIGHKELKIS